MKWSVDTKADVLFSLFLIFLTKSAKTITSLIIRFIPPCRVCEESDPPRL